jgi:hypothetical protein
MPQVIIPGRNPSVEEGQVAAVCPGQVMREER